MTRDQLIGQNIASMRGDLSQQALADAMRARGFDWAQATVWSVEKGKRPLRLAESETLADILRVEVKDLLRIPSASKLIELDNALLQAEMDLDDAHRRWESALAQAAVLADQQGIVASDVDEIMQFGRIGFMGDRFAMTAADYLATSAQVRRRLEEIGPLTKRYNAGGHRGQH